MVILKAQMALLKVFSERLMEGWITLQILCRFIKCHRWQQKRIIPDYIYLMNVLLHFTSNNIPKKT